MAADARERILDAIRAALGPGARPSEPHPLAFESAPASAPERLESFRAELQLLGGEASVVSDTSACARWIETYLRGIGVRSVAVQSSPLALEVANVLHGLQIEPAAGRTADELERIDCGLLEAQALLADTGSVVLVLSTYADRLLPYLPRTCVVVASVARLHGTLCAEALGAIDGAAAVQQGGEAVIVTGPSRTADIEKTLVFGAHGPANLAVVILM